MKTEGNLVNRIRTHGYHWEALIALVLVLAALLIRFGFLAEYPNSIMHEDSGPYVDEAERLLEGRETATGQVPGRAPGYPLFLAAIINLVSPNLLYTIGIQHLLGTGTALLLTLSLRMLGVGRLLSYTFFAAIAFAHRLIHYDNTIGAETLTVFLVSVNFFLATGMALRRWNPWACAAAIGVIFGYLILVRSATFFIPFVFAAWFGLPNVGKLCPGWPRRLALMALIIVPTVSAIVGMIQWNKEHYNRSVLSRETEPVMAFVIAYSGDFTEHGARYEVLDGHEGLRKDLQTVVEKGRATLREDGYSTLENYQWVFNIFSPLDVGRLGSQQEKDRVVSALFRETLLTPHTLYRHLTGHTLREMKFMLFDATPAANSAFSPRDLVNFTKRDGKVLRIAQARADYEPGTGIAAHIPSSLGKFLQRFTNRYIRNKYTTEYRQRPGMLRVYTVLSLTLLMVLLLEVSRMRYWLSALLQKARLFNRDRRRKSGRDMYRSSPITTEHSVVLLAFAIWLGNAMLYCTLLYALHRYSYYVYAFNAFTAFYGLHLLIRYFQARTR